ncbi:MAG: hypothetical protein JNK47_23305 [Mesorhizobium sp.]|nr:hypothetical protein [Mesorhizobium sp.]
MSLQNRVDPFGEIHAVVARGLFTGNRGIIHDPATRTLTGRRWTTKAWIVCACAYKERRREVMGYNGRNGGAGWTELFFLDEVTAFAAGHRPCFECRREAAKAYAGAFGRAFGVAKPTVRMMDARLHVERWASREHRSPPPSRSSGPIHLPPTEWGGGYPALESRRAARLAILSPGQGERWIGPQDRDEEGVLHAETLPNGTVITDGSNAYALHGGQALRWSFEGYSEPLDLSRINLGAHDVITPATTVAVLRQGYQPVWHPSAGRQAS